MRKIYLLPLFFPCMHAAAQQTVSGMVKDNKGVPISGATLAIRDSYDGGTTDSAGVFRFSTTEKGEQVLVVSAIGYKGTEIPVQVPASELQLSLKEEMNELKAVVITAGSFEASDKKRATVLSSIDILTTASANADVTGAVKTLPGAQQVGESEGLFVRGGTAAETKTFIDGTLVNNFFYSSVPNIAQRGRFSPWLFKGTVFSAGGYSALYGQALSSALILESVDLPERSSGNLGISPIGVNGGYQRLAKNKHASWGISYGYTNLMIAFAAIPQKQDFISIPQYHTGDANFRIRTSPTGMLKYYGYFSQNSLGLRQKSIDTLQHYDAFRLRNFNMYHNLAWRESMGSWKVQAGFSFATNADDIHGNLENRDKQQVLVDADGLREKNFDLRLRGQYVNGKIVFEKRLQGLSALRMGSEYNYSRDATDYTAFNGDTYPGRLAEHLLSGFGEADIYVTNDLAAKAGARVERSAMIGKMNWAPRVSLAYKLGRQSQASLAYGIFYQTPEKRYLPASGAVDFSKAAHYIAQYQQTTNLTTLRAEVFYKKYSDLVKVAGNGTSSRAASSNGHGYAKGFELFWRDKKSIKQVDYWISYSFLDTKRDFLNFPGLMEPSFAARHTANLVMKKFVSQLKTQFNANYSFATGRPYYRIDFDGASNKYSLGDAGRTPAYHSLSFSVNYLPHIFRQGASKFTVFVFSITNVLGNNQVFGYQYAYNGIRKEAITPPAKTFVYIGAFISFGVDRSDDVINSNL